MKKIILVIVFLFVFNCKVSASDVIVLEKGIGSTEHLEFLDLKLVSNNVDFDNVGVYQATYYDEHLKKYHTKTVHVVLEEELMEGLVIKEEFANFQLNDDYIIEDFLIKNDLTVIVGSKKSHDEIIQTEFIQNYGFIKCYLNNEILWEFVYDEYSEIKKIVETSTGFLVLSTLQNNGDFTDIILTEFNFDGSISRSKVFSGSNYEIGLDLVSKNEELFIVYYSYTKAEELNYRSGSRVIAISKIDKYTLDIIESKYIGNNIYTLLLDIEYCDHYDNFYILFNTNGSIGNFVYEGSYRGNFITSFNNKFEDEKFIGLSSLINPKALGIINANLYLFGEEEGTLEQRIYDNHLNYKTTINQDTTKFFLVNTVMINQMNLVYTVSSNGECLEVIDVNRGIYNFSLENEEYIKSINNQLVTLKNDNGYLSICKYNLIDQSKTGPKEYMYKSYYDQTIYINGEYISNFVSRKYDKVFGIYAINEIIDTSNLRLVFSDKYFVREVFNIEDNQIYDQGLILNFNGCGLLNDQEIDNGYLISDAGNYSLLVVGNGITKSINFKVMDLSISYDKKVNFFDEPHFNYQTPSKDEINNNFDKAIINKSSIPSVAITVVISLVGGLLGIIIPTSRRKL